MTASGLMGGATTLASHTRDANYPVLVVVGALFLAAAVYGVRVWQGRVRARPEYRSFAGSAPAAAVIGPGFVLIVVGEIIRGALDLPEDGALMWFVSIVGMMAVAIGFLYGVVYYVFGVPNRLRPPYQRDGSARPVQLGSPWRRR